jgi:hypothetical protein
MQALQNNMALKRSGRFQYALIAFFMTVFFAAISFSHGLKAHEGHDHSDHQMSFDPGFYLKDGTLLDPLCVFRAEMNALNEQVKLAVDCKTQDLKPLGIASKVKQAYGQDFVVSGYNQYKKTEGELHSTWEQGYFGYRYIDKKNGGHRFLTLHISKDGQITKRLSIFGIIEQEDDFVFTHEMSGAQTHGTCSGGCRGDMEGAGLDDNHALEMYYNFSPRLLMSGAAFDLKNSDTQSLPDRGYCEDCCLGTLVYNDNGFVEMKVNTFNYDITGFVADNDDCMLAVVESYIKGGEKSFNKIEAEMLMDQIEDSCTK